MSSLLQQGMQLHLYLYKYNDRPYMVIATHVYLDYYLI